MAGHGYATAQIKFQFQFGAINSTLRCLLCLPYKHFNSSLVRLIGRLNNQVTQLLENFNSSLVRLIELWKKYKMQNY